MRFTTYHPPLQLLAPVGAPLAQDPFNFSTAQTSVLMAYVAGCKLRIVLERNKSGLSIGGARIGQGMWPKCKDVQYICGQDISNPRLKAR